MFFSSSGSELFAGQLSDVVVVVAEHLARLRDRRLELPVAPMALHEGLEPSVFLGQLGIEHMVGDHIGIGEPSRDLLEVLLDVVESLEHAIQRSKVVRRSYIAGFGGPAT